MRARATLAMTTTSALLAAALSAAAFPPASEPLVFDAHHRSGMFFRGFRFSTRILAPAGEAEPAEIGAPSVGLSGAGRG
jgi:hypothetical protein